MNGFTTSVPFTASSYASGGPAPVIEFEAIADRHPVILTPAG